MRGHAVCFIVVVVVVFVVLLVPVVGVVGVVGVVVGGGVDVDVVVAFVNFVSAVSWSLDGVVTAETSATVGAIVSITNLVTESSALALAALSVTKTVQSL